jgi:hypothetical protein
MNLLPSYETLLELSQKMEKLASELNWDDLIQTEAERNRLLAGLSNSELGFLPTTEQQAIADIIRQIQSCDEAVREFVLPWQENVSTLLARLAPKS